MKASKAFTLVEIMIVVAIIGILVAISVPGFIHAREQSQAKACMEAQAKMEGSVDQWAMETGAAPGATGPAWSTLVGASGYLRRTPMCPIGRTVILVPNVGTAVSCPTNTPGHSR